MAEAEPLIRRALAIDEKRLGRNHPNVAIRLGNLATLLERTNRLTEAEKLMRRVLAMDEKNLGAEHRSVAIRLSNLALLLQGTNRFAEAELLMRRTLMIMEKSLGPEHTDVAAALNNLAQLLRDTNRLTEADTLMRRAFAINEKRLGPNHPHVAIDLNNLAQLLTATNRLAEAEPLMRRALAIEEKSFGPHHPNVARALSNLALLLNASKRPAEAESLMRRALSVDEKSYGPDHPSVAIKLGNLAVLLKAAGRVTEAEPLMRRALVIHEKSFGPEHPDVANDLSNLATLLQSTDRSDEAEALYRRALAIDQKSFGPTHPKVATRLNSLALLLGERGDWENAAALGNSALPIMTGFGYTKDPGRNVVAKALLAKGSLHFRAHARALHRARAQSRASQGEAFEAAQWALQTSAADAVARMAVRLAKGSGPLADLIREHQDLLGRRRGEDRRLLAVIGRGDTPAAGEIRSAIAALDAKLDSIETRLGRDFKEYAELVAPKSLGIADVQALLRLNEVLVLFLDIPRIGKLAEETLVWAITRSDARWARIDLGTRALRDQVEMLRCGLDAHAWTAGRCRNLLKVTYTTADRRSGKSPPFSHGRAHALYRSLFAPLEDMIAEKHLLVVASGPLTMLPFAALVTAQTGGDEDHAKVAWLGSRQSITILPSVASLAAVRAQARSSKANKILIGLAIRCCRVIQQTRWMRRAPASRANCSVVPAHSKRRQQALPKGPLALILWGAAALLTPSRSEAYRRCRRPP